VTVLFLAIIPEGLNNLAQSKVCRTMAGPSGKMTAKFSSFCELSALFLAKTDALPRIQVQTAELSQKGSFASVLPYISQQHLDRSTVALSFERDIRRAS
jgi:hypothetical protein